MANFNQSTRNMIGNIDLGIRVDRATSTLPQTTSLGLFDVEGGNILLTLILGEVTTVIETQANNTNLESNPDVGTAVDLCAVLDITAKEVGSLFTITGTAGDAMQVGTGGGVIGQAVPVIVAPGQIELHCAASNTGAIKWSAWYIPLETGAYVAAA